MLRIFQRRSDPSENTRSCFYCSTIPSPKPADPRNFRCSQCGCLNRYDANWRILGDEPAMYEEQLNKGAFAMKASPSKNAIPALQNSNPLFCHTCRTNQTLQINLLSNYLPPSSDPQYQSLLAQLPAYKLSLDQRYPTICNDCQPAIEEEIQRKNHMARTNVLGGWLTQTRSRTEAAKRSLSADATALAQSRGLSKKHNKVEKWLGPGVVDVKLRRTTALWRVEGVLWACTLSVSIIWNILAVTHPHYLPLSQPVFLTLTGFFLASRLWTDWDPYFIRLRKANAQGREVAVEGRETWVGNQRKTWVVRLFWSLWMVFTGSLLNTYLASSITTIEILLLSSSIWSLRFLERTQPRLITSRAGSLAPTHQSHRAQSQPTPESSHFQPQFMARSPSEVDILSTLSLTESLSDLRPRHRPSPLSLDGPSTIQPPSYIQHPVFGQTSLTPDALSIGRTSAGHDPDGDGDMEMDWDPSPATAQIRPMKTKGSAYRPMESENWMRPPKFFAKDQPTGLESLFEKMSWFGDGDDDPPKSQVTSKPPSGRKLMDFRIVGGVLLASGVLGVGILIGANVWSPITIFSP